MQKSGVYKDNRGIEEGIQAVSAGHSSVLCYNIFPDHQLASFFPLFSGVGNGCLSPLGRRTNRSEPGCEGKGVASPCAPQSPESAPRQAKELRCKLWVKKSQKAKRYTSYLRV